MVDGCMGQSGRDADPSSYSGESLMNGETLAITALTFDCLDMIILKLYV